MSQITQAIAARQTQIAQLQLEIETLQRAASIVGAPEAAAKAKPKQKPKAKPRPKATPKPKTTQKQHVWSAADREAMSRRVKASWAKRREAGVSVAPTKKASEKPAKKATRAAAKKGRKPMAAAQKKLLSARMKKYWAARRKAKG